MILPFFFLSKHQNKAEFKNLHGSEVLSSDFPSLKTSDLYSLTNLRGLNDLYGLISSKNTAPDGWIHPGNQITNTGLFLCVEWIIKNPNFH